MSYEDWDRQWHEAILNARALVRLRRTVQVLYLDPTDRLWKVIDTGRDPAKLDEEVRRDPLSASVVIYDNAVRNKIPDATRVMHIFIVTYTRMYNGRGNSTHQF